MPHVQNDYFSSFKQSYLWLVPLPSSLLELYASKSKLAVCTQATVGLMTRKVIFACKSLFGWPLVHFALMIDSSVVIRFQYNKRKCMNITYWLQPDKLQGTSLFIASLVQQRQRSLRDTETKDERTFCQSSKNYDSLRKILPSCSVSYPDPAVHTVAADRDKPRKK